MTVRRKETPRQIPIATGSFLVSFFICQKCENEEASKENSAYNIKYLCWMIENPKKVFALHCLLILESTAFIQK